MSEAAALFQPFTCRGLTIPNRLVMAPMTRMFSPGGVPGDDVRDYYVRRAAADVGLIITEGTTTRRPGASLDPNVPNFHAPEALAGWKRVTDAVHGVGGKIAPQLWHAGMMRKPGSGAHPDAASDSPSGLTHKGKPVAQAPTEEEVWDMVRAFAEAAGDAARLGFDAIEIHGAHGYLIDEFFWDVMNVREDRFGGSLPKRSEFAAAIVRECRKEAGEAIPIIFRFSQWKQQDYSVKLAATPQELEAMLAPIVDAGADILHASQRRFWEPEFPDVDGPDGLNTAGWTKKLLGVPTITVGSVGLSSDFITGWSTTDSADATGLDRLLKRFERGEFDLVGVGRALLQDPLWVSKVKDGRMQDIAAYDPKSQAVLY